MFTFSHRGGGSLVSPKLQPDKAENNLKHKTTIELLRLRGRYADNQSELELIEAELNRRQRWEYLAYTVLIATVMLIGVFMSV